MPPVATKRLKDDWNIDIRSRNSTRRSSSDRPVPLPSSIAIAGS
jgi:hypothetical protein